jgi:hypothetical protein
MIYGLIYIFTEHEERVLTNLENDLFDSIASKLAQPLFQTNIRFSVSSSDRTATLFNDFCRIDGNIKFTRLSRNQLCAECVV